MTAAAPSGTAAVHLNEVHTGGNLSIVFQGIASLSTDYATRIGNFFTEYLGTPRHPVPFGGRDDALKLADRWVEDERAPPRLLIAAPAGRGKSALLVRWSQRLVARSEVHVAFMPVSIRFRTNLASVVFSTMSARLAAIHGDPVPGSPDQSAEAWRSILSDYLARPLPDGCKLVVILDGIDEAADWTPGPDMFPLALPAGLRLVVSARYLGGDTDAGDWLRRIGWDRPGLAQANDLGILSPKDVAEVLTAMGLPLDRLAANVDVVKELHRLSEGDPLLVRLYVEDIWSLGESAARLCLEDLRVLSPGLEGFFDRWWDDQSQLWGATRPLQERAVQVLLDLMACALGPLTREDILDNLLPGDSAITAWSLDDALRPLGRFVLGDGKSQGYTFSHPRLGFYFHERLTTGERAQIEARFIVWGKTVLEAFSCGELKPDQVSPYLVQYFSTHLHRADADTSQYVSLISDGWRRAWLHLEGSYSGFLSDITHVWRRIDHADCASIQEKQLPAYLGETVRCALCDASIRSLAGNLPPTLLRVLVERRIWSASQALAHARQASPQQQVEAYGSLLSCLPASVQTEVLGQALGLVEQVTLEDERVEMLGSIAHVLTTHFQGRALAIVSALGEVSFKVRALGLLAPWLEPPHVDEALSIARSIHDQGVQMQALAAIAPSQPVEVRTELIREVLENTILVGDDLRRVVILRGLAQHLSSELWPAIHRAILATRQESLRAEVMAHLLPQLASTEPERVLGEIASLPGPGARARVLVACIDTFPPGERKTALDDALVCTGSMDAHLWKAQILAEVARHTDGKAHHKVVEEALGILDRLAAGGRSVNEQRVVDIIDALASGGDGQVAERLFAVIQSRLLQQGLNKVAALAVLVPHVDETLQARALHYLREFTTSSATLRTALTLLLPHLPETLREQALAMAGAIPEGGIRRQTLADLAPFHNDARLQVTLATIRTIEDEQPAMTARASVGALLRGPAVLQALDEALRVDSPSVCARLVTALGPCLVEYNRARLLAAVATITDQAARADALVGLAVTLQPDRLSPLLNVARSIEDQESRHRAVFALAPKLLQLDEDDALDAITAITKDGQVGSARAALERCRTETTRNRLLEAVMYAFLQTPWEERQLEQLLHLTVDLPLAYAFEALKALCRTDVWDWCAPLISSKRLCLILTLIEQLPADSIPDELLPALLDVLEGIDHRLIEPYRVDVLPQAGTDETLDSTPIHMDSISAVMRKLSSAQLHAARKWACEFAGFPKLIALMTLAWRFPPVEGGALFEVALDWARNWSDDEAGVLLMIEAARTDHRDEATPELLLGEAVARSRKIADGFLKAGLLIRIAAELPAAEASELRQEAAAAARSAAVPERRYRALLQVALQYDGDRCEELLEQAVIAIAEIATDGRRARALVELMPHLPARLLETVVDSCGTFGNMEALVQVLSGLAAHAPVSLMNKLLDRVSTSLDEDSAASIIIDLAPRLPGQHAISALYLAVEIEDPETRRSTFHELAPRLTILAPDELHTVWCAILRRLSLRGRAHLLSDIGALGLLIRQIGGEQALQDSKSAIVEATTWWP